MLRSYKKNPICSDRSNGAKFWKKVGNKKVRKSDDFFLKGNKYKKIYNSWEIHDYILRWTKEQAIKSYRKGYYSHRYKSEKEFLDKCWEKYYKRK